MKKSILCLLLALILCLGMVFVSCKKDKDEEGEGDSTGKKGEIKVTAAAEDAVVNRPNEQVPGYTIGY